MRIKTYKQFEQSSFFYSEDDINKILDKINGSGYKSLSDSERSILLNYSKDDSDIHEILIKLKDIRDKFRKLNSEIQSLMQKGKQQYAKEKFQKEWLVLNNQAMKYEYLLRYLYKIEDPNDLYSYEVKHGLNEEVITAQDYKNKIELDMEIAQKENEKPNNTVDDQKLAKLKITDIQKKIEFLNKQKSDIISEITRLQDNQRNLMPDNPSDPNNKTNQQKFIAEQTEKITAQRNKLSAFDQEIKLLQKDIERNKGKYRV